MLASQITWQILLLVALVGGEKTGRSPSRRHISQNGLNEVTLNYWFKSRVEDVSRGFLQGRNEARHGDQVHGSYEYSDGHVRVKVIYRADKNGYRVIKEERVTLRPFYEPTERPRAKKFSKPVKGARLHAFNQTP